METKVGMEQLSVEERRILLMLATLGPQRAIYDAAAHSLCDKGLTARDLDAKVLVLTDEGKQVSRLLSQS